MAISFKCINIAYAFLRNYSLWLTFDALILVLKYLHLKKKNGSVFLLLLRIHSKGQNNLQKIAEFNKYG